MSNMQLEALKLRRDTGFTSLRCSTVEDMGLVLVSPGRTEREEAESGTLGNPNF